LKAARIHWASAAQFGLSVLVIINLWIVALSLLLVGITGPFIQTSTPFREPLPLILMATAAAISGILLLPSAYYALLRLLGWRPKDTKPILKRMHPSLWIFALPVVLLLGNLVSNNSYFSWWALPVLHLLAVGLPIVWILYLSVRRLPLGSAQRTWGIFGSGLTLAPASIMIAEAIAGLAFLGLVVYYFINHPDQARELSRLAHWLRSSNPSREAIIQKLGPSIIKPSVMFLVLVFSAIVVPIIEELLKPIGVWLLAGRKLSPAAGFTAGAISGAAYAFIESLVLTSNDQQWASMVVARIGTSVIHIFTTGLTGWAIVQTWNKHRIKLFIVSFLAAISIHGLWNALIMVSSFTILASQLELKIQTPGLSNLSQVTPLGLLILTVGAFCLLIYANHSLYRTQYVKEIDQSQKYEPEE